MQIFHLLPAGVMAKWETLEQEFYNGEWTLQVLHVMLFIATQFFEQEFKIHNVLASSGFNFVTFIRGGGF